MIFFFKLVILKCRFSLISHITGLAPQSTIASIVAIKLNDWVITSSPRFTPTAFKAHLRPAVPDETARE